MLRITRFMKPFLGSVALAVLLLIVQAVCDLNLPNLMSDIVNVGIQQGGVEDRSPEALSSEAYELSTAFMDDEHKTLVSENYVLTLPGDLSPDGRAWSERYPQAGSEGFYLRDTNIDAATRSELDEAFGLSTWTMVYVLQELAENGTENLGIEMPSEAQADSTTEDLAQVPADAATATAESDTDVDLTADISSIDFSAIYEMMPLIPLIPEDTLASYQKDAAAVDQLMLEESSTMMTRNFYRELGVNMGDYEIGYIVRIGLIMLALTALGGVATVLVGLLSSRAGAGLARDLRSAIFHKVMAFSHTEFDRFSTASLITRSTNDVAQIQMLVTLGIRMIFYAPIMGAGAVFMALQTSVSMSWIIGVGVLFMIGMIGILMVIVMPKFKIIQKLIDRLNLVARESLNGQMVIRAFSRSRFEMDRFEEANTDVTNTNLFIQRAMVFMMPVMMIFMNGLTVLIIWVGAEQVAASTMQVGDMMAYMQYAMMVVMSFMFIAMAFIFVPRASVSAGRIADVLETTPVISDPEQPQAFPAERSAGSRGRIEFKDVSFSYEGADAPALEHIDFVAEPGKTTALIGSTGSGKTTMLNLIPRFYDVTGGTVLFDGVDVRELSISDLRSRIGYVPQKSLLMSGTVAENIAYGNPELADADIKKAAEVAQALDFISKLEVKNESAGETGGDGSGEGGPETSSGRHGGEAGGDGLASGFDFEIAQGGGNVSGGQRQRLAIARALAIEPEVFLFDDSFSALDFATDAALRKALAAFTQNATLIIVAQRVSTIMDAECIYVVEDGKITGKGTHAQLLNSSSAYREVAETQLSPEELEASLVPSGQATKGGDVQ